MPGLDANGRVDKALRMLTPALLPIVEKELRRVYRANWQQNISAAHGTDLKSLDAYALLKTMIDNWQSVFKDGFKAKTRTDVSKALDGRNAVSHASGVITDADSVSYLTAIRGVAEAIQAKAVAADVGKLIDDQFKAAASAMGVTPAVAAKSLAEPAAPRLDLGDRKYPWKPWRDVCPPHPDVMAARFIEAEFAANLADVARGEGPETYRDPREFFRITYMTGGLRQVLQRTIERLSGNAYEAALVILPPSALQRGREQDTPAVKLAADIVEHKGPGQRRNRNRLAFLAVDQAVLIDIQSVVRKKLAWESIVADSRSVQLPRAQEEEAKKKADEQEAAAVSAVRRGWKHLLLPQEPQRCRAPLLLWPPGTRLASRRQDPENPRV